ncbi:MAG: hypothetical protein NWR72_17035 [Bacteroidia bacterium]|nr:hypothetical protein [Bacteroidia bacterium]
MDTLFSFLSDADFWKYTSIPFLSGFVGWFTNVIALKMTFYPLKFVGIGKLGWQGIIPSRAGFMAGKAVDLIASKLVTIEDRFAQLDPERVAEEMEPAINRITAQIVDEVMTEEAPEIWENAPKAVKDGLYLRASEEIPAAVVQLMRDIKERITELFDLRRMVVETLEGDPDLLNQIFLQVGSKEFIFIEKSGFYFGFLFGLVQMALFIAANTLLGFDLSYTVWILPVAGLFVGWATNVLALRMIFEPVRPRRYFFFITFQGLFLQRQKEVASAYAKLISERVLSSRQIMEELVSGPASERLFALVHLHIRRGVDASAGFVKPLFQLARGTKSYVNIKTKIARRFEQELPHSLRYLFPYAQEALDIENSMRTKMQALSAPEFVGFLRPIFQEDEWKLILVGAVLGFLAGLAQMMLVFAPV